MTDTNALSAKMVEVISQLQGIVKDNAADALNLGLTAISIQSVATILGGFLLLLIFLLCARLFCNDKHRELDVLFIVGGFGSLGVGSCLFFDVWNWVAIFSPKLWLAHQVIAKLG